ncbi:MAG: hypothetical protein AB7Q29_04190 [Vicinamibacterales bacterium]
MADASRPSAPGDAVRWSETAGGWLVTRYEDVQRVLTDWRTFSSAPPPIDLSDWFTGRRSMRAAQPLSIVGMDPPEHGPHRRIVASLLSRESVAAIEPRVHAIAAGLIGAIERERSCDLVDSYTAPLPLMVLAELLGIDPHAHRTYRRWAEAVPRMDDVSGANGDGDVARRDDARRDGARRDALREFELYFEAFGRTLLADRRETQLGRLVAAGALTQREAVRFAKLLLLAGSSTTSHLIANVAVALLADRPRLDALAAQPSGLERFIEAVLRAEPPVRTVARVTTTSVSIGGVELPAGARVLAVIGTANAEQPERRSLSMGAGPHVCPGGDLGTMEAIVAVTHLIPLLRRATLSDPVRYYASARIRAPQRLVLAIAPFSDPLPS